MRAYEIPLTFGSPYTPTNWSLSWKDRRVTNYDRQIVDLGGYAAGSVDYSTVPATASRLTDARLLPSTPRQAAVAGRALKRGQ